METGELILKLSEEGRLWFTTVAPYFNKLLWLLLPSHAAAWLLKSPLDKFRKKQDEQSK